MRKALANYDGTTLITELNSAVGTLEDEKKEERLEALIHQLEQYPEALGDYREWLQAQEIESNRYATNGKCRRNNECFR